MPPTLNEEDPVAATTCFRQADIKSSTIFYKKRIEGISYFQHTVALSGLDKVRPPHLTRETLSGRRPADGADTLGGVFRPGENLTLGAEGKIKSADAA